MEEEIQEIKQNLLLLFIYKNKLYLYIYFLIIKSL